MERAAAAQQLKTNKLLPQLLEQLETDLIQRWRGSATVEQREEAWIGLRQLDLLAGAIEDAAKRYSDGD